MTILRRYILVIKLLKNLKKFYFSIAIAISICLSKCNHKINCVEKVYFHTA